MPRACPDHAQSLVRMALKMCEYIKTRPPSDGTRLDIRIGIHSGPIVAGVIGRKRFAKVGIKGKGEMDTWFVVGPW